MADHGDGKSLETHILEELPGFPRDLARELAGAIERLIQALHPERVYVFGSRARGEAASESDVDLLVVLSTSDNPPHRNDQLAYQAVGPHTFPLDILVMTRDEFERRSATPASLPATVLREGRLLFAA